MSERIVWVVKNDRGEYLESDVWCFTSDRKHRLETDYKTAAIAASDPRIHHINKRLVKVTIKKSKNIIKNDAEINKAILTKIYNAAFPTNKWFVEKLSDHQLISRYDEITTILKDYGMAPLDAYK